EAKNTKNTSFYSFLSANARSFASLRMTDQQCLSSKIGFRYNSNDDYYKLRFITALTHNLNKEGGFFTARKF
ncbi:MAG: hypothetical protein FWC80_05815, partial [Firmicutes bacterium]|nr:hypothetical protein [Bacillota bacterium]